MAERKPHHWHLKIHSNAAIQHLSYKKYVMAFLQTLWPGNVSQEIMWISHQEHFKLFNNCES